MTRDELLKKCVERGVADEPTVSSVSHLFYVFLLSALQRGQRVEIPNFGTFGTRVIGIKRTRKMPYFEADVDLAGAVNERYRDMKYVVVGRYEEHPLGPGTTYAGKEPPYDPLVDQVGREVIVDTHHEVSAGEVEAAQKKASSPTKEKPDMPKFNLKGEEEEGRTTPPALHDEDEGRGPGPLMQVLIAILILALLTLALHFFGVIRLWGPAEVQQATLPEPVIQQPVAVDTVAPTTPTPVPTEKPKPPVKSKTGSFTVQVSSWETKFKANDEMSRLTAANFDAFVEEGTVNGERWYRVRVGRYESRAEAATAAERLGRMLENGAWVTQVGR
ncbi:MAG: SPOR domain-containing protein [Ignavibacteria bacterium]|nr:SPOR domain-containing protein [Ignavibacteria bacterium]